MFVWLFTTPFDGISVFIQTGFAIDIGFVAVQFIDIVCDEFAFGVVPWAAANSVTRTNCLLYTSPSPRD